MSLKWAQDWQEAYGETVDRIYQSKTAKGEEKKKLQIQSQEKGFEICVP